MSTKSIDQLSILVVDDEDVVRDSLTSWFEVDGLKVGAAGNAREALTLLKESHWDLALVDIKMPGIDGLELQRRIRDVSPDTTIIIMTAYASVDSAIQALKQGAYDYISKPFDPDHLTHLIRKAAERSNLEQENINLKKQLATVVQPQEILGQSPQIKRALELVQTVAGTETTVLITGESGTGKELVARAIHVNSQRAYLPLVVVNSGALHEGTLESELFGHERGAFTGAIYRHKGKFELADGGTLFMDEIAEVSHKIQVELLRVLEDKQITRLGGTKPVRADFRLIVATNKNLAKEMKAGKFREDLYYRLNVFHIELPPLRERKGDIPVLARAFTERLARNMNHPVPVIDAESMKMLESYEWPGNVRELANAIERAMVVHKGGRIRPGDLPIALKPAIGLKEAPRAAMTLAEVEKRHLEFVLGETEWNISQAARVLGVDRTTIYNKIKHHGLNKE